MASSAIFSIDEAIQVDDSIQRYEVHGYSPEVGTNINSTGEIRINITTKDTITHPYDSYLLIEGRLMKVTDDGTTSYADADTVTLANNGLMYLFSNIKYGLSDREIENINYVGQATTMLGLLKYSRGYARTQGLNQLLYKDMADVLTDTNLGFKIRHEYIIKAPTAKGTFSFAIPLKHIFRFCEDYDNVVYGATHRLTLNRQSDNDAIVRKTDAGAGKVTLTKLEWMMPLVKPSDEVKLPFYKKIESKPTLEVTYNARQCFTNTVPQNDSFSWTLPSMSANNFPKYIIVGFQTDRRNSQTKNSSVFNHCNVTSIRVWLNTSSYPVVDYKLSFPNNQFSRAYRDVATLSAKMFGLNELITECNITTTEYKGLYPLFVFDVSRREENIILSSVDLRIEATFSENVAANTHAYALVISDKMCSFKYEGTSLSVVG
jgi:hypothetical protein